MIYDTALSMPETQKYRRLKKGEEFKDFEAREREETMATALAQPHRRGSDDIRLSEPLGRFCAAHKLRDECYNAGVRYAEIVGEAKTAQGFPVPGWTPGDSGFEKLTEAQIFAKKELAVQRLKDVNGALIAVIARLPRAMERVCFDQLAPAPADEAIIAHGLYRLAVDFGMIRNFHRVT